MSCKGIFILSIIWIFTSPVWFFVVENTTVGIIRLCGGIIELIIAHCLSLHCYGFYDIPGNAAAYPLNSLRKGSCVFVIRIPSFPSLRNTSSR